MAKLFIQTERMKNDFKEFEESKEDFTQSDLNHIAEELVYFAEYAAKNKIKTIYDLEEKLNLPFEAYLDGFENDVLDSEGLDYKPVLEAYKKLLTTFCDEFLFEIDCIRFITNMYFRVGDSNTAEAFMLGFLEDNPDAYGYLELINGFVDIDLAKAKKYLEEAKSMDLDNKDILDTIVL